MNEKINDIAASAAMLRPAQYKKSMAFDIVRKLIQTPESIDDNDLSVLYRQFMPPLPAKPKTAEQWIALAMGKKDVRYYLNWVYSDGARIVATDGHRLHFYKTDKYPAGFYDKTMTLVHDTNYGRYPDFDRVIPDPESREHAAKIDQFEIVDYKTDGKAVCLYEIGYQVQVKDSDEYITKYLYINKQYLDQALRGFDNPYIHYTDKHSSVLICEGDKTAVIMPTRR